MPFNACRELKVDEQEFYIKIKIIEAFGLIYNVSNDKGGPSNNVYKSVLPDCADFANSGGFKSEKNRQINQHEQDVLHNETERQLKWYEKENARITYEDYPNVKRNAKWALRVALFVAGLELLKWIVEISKSSTGH